MSDALVGRLRCSAPGDRSGFFDRRDLRKICGIRFPRRRFVDPVVRSEAFRQIMGGGRSRSPKDFDAGLAPVLDGDSSGNNAFCYLFSFPHFDCAF